MTSSSAVDEPMPSAEDEQSAAEVRELVGKILGSVGSSGEAWLQLADSGLTLAGVPEAAGGSGGSILHAAAVLESVAACGFDLPLVESTWLAAWVAARSSQQVPSGPVTFAIAHDATIVDDLPGGSRLRGVTVVPRYQGIAEAHILVPDAGVVAVIPLDTGSDAAALASGELVLDHRIDDVRCHAVPDPQGMVAEAALRAGLARTVQIAGAAGTVRDLAVRYAAQRQQFGRPLSKNQVIQHYLAQVAAEAHAVRTAARSAVRAWAERGVAAAGTVRAAKAVAGLSVEPCTRLAHQVFGAIGTTREHELHRYTMAMWAWRDDAGSEFEHGQAIGAAALGVSEDPWTWLINEGERE